MKKIKKYLKDRNWTFDSILLLVFIIFCVFLYALTNYEKQEYEKEYNDLKEEYSYLQDDYDILKSNYNALDAENDSNFDDYIFYSDYCDELKEYLDKLKEAYPNIYKEITKGKLD